jgi:hypothetical protein
MDWMDLTPFPQLLTSQLLSCTLPDTHSEVTRKETLKISSSCLKTYATLWHWFPLNFVIQYVDTIVQLI